MVILVSTPRPAISPKRSQSLGRSRFRIRIRTQGYRRVAEREAGKGGNQGDEGWEIHVAQVQALARGHVVELVPEVTVVAVGEQVHHELEGSQVGQDCRSAEPTSSRSSPLVDQSL